MFTKKIKTYFLSALLIILPMIHRAQSSWYAGFQAGSPMAESNFSSFGVDKFRFGWNAGINAGYQFTKVWSLELTANWGQQFLAEQKCCYNRAYFLGSDNNRYLQESIPAGMQCHSYKDLKSRVFVQRYGLQVNVNVLGIFNRTKDSRWRLDVSPAIYAAGTKSDLMTKADNAIVTEHPNDWHIAYGGMAQASYQITDNIDLGVYGGFTHLLGDAIDGMPALHTRNHIIDAGVKMSYRFGKRNNENNVMEEIEVVENVEDVKNVEVIEMTEIEDIEDIENIENIEEIEDIEVIEDISDSMEAETEIPEVIDSIYCVIYFSFNSVWIEPDERHKVKEIAKMMNDDDSANIIVEAWGDEIGGEEKNLRVSWQRANAVKDALIRYGIDGERIETQGSGIMFEAESAEKARCANIIIK